MFRDGLGLKGYSLADEQCPYQIIQDEKPSRGGFATVYLARSRTSSSLKQLFALKEIVIRNEDLLKDVKEEIKILKGLRHPNILVLEQAFYSKEDPRKVYLATLPWAPQSLHIFFCNLLKTDRLDGCEWYVPGDLKPWSSIFMQCLYGLHYLHANGIKHKDLKPHNILLHQNNERGRPWICPIIADFGLSKNYIAGGLTDNRGTHEFMAPEQFQGGELSELSSDIWSLGCCFAFVWVLLHSGKQGLHDFWAKILDSEPLKRGFHTDSNIKATHELLEKSFTRSKDIDMIVFLPKFGDLVKKMLDVERSNRPGAYLAFVQYIALVGEFTIARDAEQNIPMD